MEQINIHDAKTHLSRLVERAAGGEEIIIAKAGKPVARLVPLAPQMKPRVFGSMKGQIWIADDFDDTPQEVIDLFEGSESEQLEGDT